MVKFTSKLQIKAEDWLTLLSAGAVGAMMVITVVDVIMRRGFHEHLKGSYEYVTLLFVFVIYFGLAYAQRRDKQISIPLLYGRLSQRGRYIVEGATLVICLVMFGTLTWYTTQSAWFNFLAGDTLLGAIQVLTWPSRFAVPVGTGMICLRLLVQIGRLVRRRELFEEAVRTEEIKV